jgi:hypothetical protein
MKKLSTILAITIAATLLAGCERDEEGPATPAAGKGGNATVNVTPQHHGKDITQCTVYIKYGAQDKPSTYDDSVVCTMVGGKPVATFSTLHKGNYYFYGRGYDPDIVQNVNGGLPYMVAEEKTYDITLPVTEVH